MTDTPGDVGVIVLSMCLGKLVLFLYYYNMISIDAMAKRDIHFSQLKSGTLRA